VTAALDGDGERAGGERGTALRHGNLNQLEISDEADEVDVRVVVDVAVRHIAR
jgi:hypothetical protein